MCVQPVCPDHDAAVARLSRAELSEELSLPELQLRVSGIAADHGATLMSGSLRTFEAIGTLNRSNTLMGALPVIASARDPALAALEIGNRYRLAALLVERRQDLALS